MRTSVCDKNPFCRTLNRIVKIDVKSKFSISPTIQLRANSGHTFADLPRKRQWIDPRYNSLQITFSFPVNEYNRENSGLGKRYRFYVTAFDPIIFDLLIYFAVWIYRVIVKCYDTLRCVDCLLNLSVLRYPFFQLSVCLCFLYDVRALKRSIKSN